MYENFPQRKQFLGGKLTIHCVKQRIQFYLKVKLGQSFSKQKYHPRIEVDELRFVHEICNFALKIPLSLAVTNYIRDEIKNIIKLGNVCNWPRIIFHPVSFFLHKLRAKSNQSIILFRVSWVQI